ncbi:MAG: hypothetical protein K6F68_02820 [Clostridiales bacterium]|nr:hypothetical protein [Clostridiales bacterium]
MSYCEKCGQFVDDSTRYCQNCGEENKNYVAPMNAYQASAYQQAPVAEQPKNGLNVMAIVAIALSELGVVGLIFAIIALKNAKSGTYRTPLKPLAVAALVVSIIMTVFWLIYICVFGAAACAAVKYGGSGNFNFDY